MKYSLDQYYQILEIVVFSDDPLVLEGALIKAFDLGRALNQKRITQDQLLQIHHMALFKLSKEYPLLSLAEVIDRINLPLMEVSMIYSMAVRSEIEHEHQVALESSMEQSRMESVGLMAAGIAHDFNNILGSITGYTELTSDYFQEGSLGKENLNQVLIAAFRAKLIIQRLLDFCKQVPTPGVLIELVAQIKESLSLLNVAYRPTLMFDFNSSLSEAFIFAEAGQLQQVIMNLCINAADAQAFTGLVSILLTPTMLDNEPAVCLTVADQGHGIEPELIKHIFMPFFTTKPPNQGSGLGLSVVYGIINNLGGKILVSSNTEGPERGTKFQVKLPLAKPSEIDNPLGQ